MSSSIVHRTSQWYAHAARDLPWRGPEVSPWAVMVSEFMLQQTPVNRVLPVFAAWLQRWPTPQDLADSPTGEAVKMWGRLGYPRRALRLHAAASAICADHAGVVPHELAQLRALPGVGEYTAAAVATFAFEQRHVVLDTNVRRVLGRVVSGSQYPPKSTSKAERDLAAELLPEERTAAATWSIAAMELGALVCTSARPKCTSCPIAAECAWRAAGYPESTHAPRTQTYAGTDRQCRGRILALVRDADDRVPQHKLDTVWDDSPQRERCLSSLLTDQLIEGNATRGYALPS